MDGKTGNDESALHLLDGNPLTSPLGQGYNSDRGWPPPEAENLRDNYRACDQVYSVDGSDI